jgi:Caenorhabditis protein of unknown function, DUF268.
MSDFKGKKLYLWGLGTLGIRAIWALGQGGFKLSGLIDANPHLQGRDFMGHQVFAPLDILALKDEAFIVVAASPSNTQAMAESCLAAGWEQSVNFIEFSEFHRRFLSEIVPARLLPVYRPPAGDPPREVPPEHLEEFTMGGKIPVTHRYFNETGGFSTANSPKFYQYIFERFEDRTFSCWYGREADAFYDALGKYDPKGQTVIIWGLLGCNCEAMALWKGAARVVVVEYNKPQCEYPRLEIMNHEELRASNLKADLAISFSSFEHDGLGGYGDPIDPQGDLKAMKMAAEYLKDDGRLFLGVPLGRDCLMWNQGRIYGPARLPLLLSGWQCLDVFNSAQGNSPDFPFDLPLEEKHQPILVLGREGRAPKADNGAGEAAAGPTWEPRLKHRINEMLSLSV